jgi:hypothetical protein
MFGVLDIIVLILVCRRHCTRCDRVFWAPPVHSGEDICIGRESYVCLCGNRYETGRREWTHLSPDEKQKYLWSGLLMLPVVATTLAAMGGYFLKWHEPYWFMSVFIGFLGLLSGVICSAVLLLIRGLPVIGSLRRTGCSDPLMTNTAIRQH